MRQEMGKEDLFVLYNTYQEDWHRKQDEKEKSFRCPEDMEPIIIIPDKMGQGLSIHSSCMLVRKDSADRLGNLKEGDYEAAKEYLNQMQLL